MGSEMCIRDRARPRIGVDLRALVPRPTGIGVYTEALLRELLERREFDLVGLSHAPLHESVELSGRDLEIEVHGGNPVDVRCHDGHVGDEFARSARELSNCPSGAEGGDLGWLESSDCAPEFAKELFGQIEVGVLPRLVHSRFGLHVVEVLQREPGQPQPYAAVSGAVAMALRQQSYVTALRQYLQVLAAGADITGVELDAADTPLVQ